jgi:hypothetical protein
MNNHKDYDDEQRSTFCEMATEIGIGRSIRELGYPTYPTAIGWMKARGVVPNIDKVMQQAKIWHQFYQVEDLLEQVDTALAVVQELVMTCTNADDAKKLSEAMQKLVNTRLLLEGKSTSINEKRETTQQDLEIQELLRIEMSKQHTDVQLDENNVVIVHRRDNALPIIDVVDY